MWFNNNTYVCGVSATGGYGVYMGQQYSSHIRSVHGSGWEDFLTQPTMVGQKKFNPTQPNPTQPNPHGLGWVGLDNFFIIIIIKLSRKKYITFTTWVDKKKYTLIYKLIFQLSCKRNMLKYPTELINKI